MKFDLNISNTVLLYLKDENVIIVLIFYLMFIDKN